jgi:hypothetical protein
MSIELRGIFSSAKGKAFRIFVSSPGDLGDERLTCARVIGQIKDEFAHVACIEPILWEQEPLTADASFQDQIPLPSETDLVVIMIWSRLGYRLHSRYKEAEDSEAPTVTIFEFRDALRARRTSVDHRSSGGSTRPANTRHGRRSGVPVHPFAVWNFLISSILRFFLGAAGRRRKCATHSGDRWDAAQRSSS